MKNVRRSSAYSLAAASLLAAALAACGQNTTGGNPSGPQPDYQVQELSGIASLSSDSAVTALSVAAAAEPGFPGAGEPPDGDGGFAPPLPGAIEIRPEGACVLLETSEGDQYELVLNLPPENLPFDGESLEAGEVELPDGYAVTVQGAPRPDLDPRCGADEVFEVRREFRPLIQTLPAGALPLQFIGKVVKTDECLSLLSTAPDIANDMDRALIAPVGPLAAGIGELAAGTVVAAIGEVVPVLEPGRCGMLVRIMDYKTFEGPPPVPKPAQARGILRQSRENEGCWQLVPPGMAPFIDPLPPPGTPDFDEGADLPDGFVVQPPQYPGALPGMPVDIGGGPVEISIGGDAATEPMPLPAVILPVLPLVPVLEPMGPLAGELKNVEKRGHPFHVRGFPLFGRMGQCRFSLPFYISEYEELPPPPPPEGDRKIVGIALHLDIEGGCNVLDTPMGFIRPIGEVADAWWADESHLGLPAIITGTPAADEVDFCPGRPFFVSEAAPFEPPEPAGEGDTVVSSDAAPGSLPADPGILPVDVMTVEGLLTSHPNGCLTLDAADSDAVYVLLYPYHAHNPGFVGGPFTYPSSFIAEGLTIEIAEDAPEGTEIAGPPCEGIPLSVYRLHRKVEIDESELPADIIGAGDWDGIAPPRPFITVRSEAQYGELRTGYSFLPAEVDVDFATETLAVLTAPGEGISVVRAFTIVEPAALVVAFEPSPGNPAEGLHYTLVRVPKLDLPVIYRPVPPPLPD